ncbi:MAG: putative HtrA2 peptidase [Candidatus Saccharibacteria bacterium]|nr:putative HtrA2 peptidase [Candidatus Saccharibacteria bacterium]
MEDNKLPQPQKDDAPEATPPESTTPVKRKRSIILPIIIAVIVLCAIAGYGGVRLFSMLSTDIANKNGTNHQSLANDGNTNVTQEEENISNVVDKVGPSVVSIVTTSRASTYYGTSAGQEGAGTGIIVSKSGYILTNKHVIDGAATVQVILSDGTTYDNVQVLGTDPLNDVAFLKIDKVSNLPAAGLGDSTSIRVGQKVVAIGNSLGQYQNTVTSGIISGTNRPISAQAGDSVENLTDLIQTDAAINPGNSGGPLLNLSGQVIGINTAIAQDAQGIGFSIPINATKGILKGVLAGKGVQRGYLGINFIPITADAAEYYKLSVKKGAYVFSASGSAVVAGSPADRAGIKDKDIITKVGGIEVGDKGGVSSLIAEYAPGDTIQLTVLRDGKSIDLSVTLDAYKS